MNHSLVARGAMLAASHRKEVAKSRRWWNVVKSHIRRTAIEVLNIFINHDWVFGLIGLLNRRLGIIESVFLVYPAAKEFGLWFAYPFRLRRNQWDPWPTGLLFQNGRLIAMFAISANNERCASQDNIGKLVQVAERMERLRQLLGAKRKTFAGILPGVLLCRRIIREAPEADLTAAAVLQAVEEVRAKESLAADAPIVVLGGKGFIGRRVMKGLDKSTALSIDLTDGQSNKDWPKSLNDRRIIVLNIASKDSIAGYFDAICPGTVLVNEAYPGPGPDVLKKLSEKGCRCYHIVGVEAGAFPSFPFEYQDAIPCCAAWFSTEMKVVVRRLI
jgi:hypothetical protein